MWCCSDSLWWQTNPTCRSLLRDSESCGWCGHECAENKTCVAGLCMPKRRTPCDGECGAGETCCWVLGQEWCVDARSDPLHCGGCETICDWGNLCRDGRCVPWTEVVDPCVAIGRVNCGAGGSIACEDLDSDPFNCGGCRNTCGDGATCVGGVCVDEEERDAQDVD